jgi:type III restriction enzyme
VVGGDACVRDTRTAVWTLVQLKQLGRNETELLADFPGLTQDDLDAVWRYYREHTDEIEKAIAAEAAED